jgi:hypothetical protein
MKRIIGFVTFLALSVAVSHVHAQAVGDPQNGLALAQQVCSSVMRFEGDARRTPRHRHS